MKDSELFPFENHKRTAKRAGIGGVIIIAVLLIAYFKGIPHVLNVMAIIGAVASTWGLFIVLLQVYTIRKTSDKVQEASEEAKNQVMNLLSTIDITKTGGLITDIQKYIRDGKFEISCLKMKDLNDILTEIIHNPRLNDIIDHNKYFIHKEQISRQIRAIEKEMDNPTGNFNVPKANEILNDIYNDISDIVSRIKQTGGSI